MSSASHISPPTAVRYGRSITVSLPDVDANLTETGAGIFEYPISSKDFWRMPVSGRSSPLRQRASPPFLVHRTPYVSCDLSETLRGNVSSRISPTFRTFPPAPLTKMSFTSRDMQQYSCPFLFSTLLFVGSRIYGSYYATQVSTSLHVGTFS